MKQWKVSFCYTEKGLGGNIVRGVNTVVFADTQLEAQRIVYAQYGRNIKNLIISAM